MKKIEISKNMKMLLALFAIVFVGYNLLLFLICGFSGHTANFWISWIFMLISFASMFVCGVFLCRGELELKDWIFGFPVLKHCFVYLICQFAASTALIVLDGKVNVKISLAAQVLMLLIHLAMVVSSFFVKEAVRETETRSADKTRFMKGLRVEISAMAAKCADIEVKRLCEQLAEEAAFSDPVSSPVLADDEAELAKAVSDCEKSISAGQYGEAKRLCIEARHLLSARNIKCRTLK